MVTLRTPKAPATSKQLWLLHILTKTDTRKLNITMQQASDRINELKSNNGKRPLVNPHASAIKQDKQKLAQARFDKTKPEREVIQGVMPQGKTNLDIIQADFKANAYQQGYDFANNPNVKVGFYDFNCKECLLGKSGICEPEWTRASYTTCQQVVESVSFNCNNYEPMQYSISEYCHRPKGKQCHRNKIDNRCLECNYRKPAFRDGYNHSAWARYIPAVQDRIKHHSFWLTRLGDNLEALNQVKHMIELLNKLA